MKNLISLLIACAIFTAMTIVAVADDTIKVIVNSKPVAFDQAPIIQDGRTLVPMRAIFEAMGCTVDWEAASQKITAKGSGKTVVMNINNVTMKVTEQKGVTTYTLDVPPQIVGGRTLVPVRAISEALGADVNWNGDTRTVTVSAVTYLRTMDGYDGRRPGAVKGPLSIDNQSVRVSVDKSKPDVTNGKESTAFAEYTLDGTYSRFEAAVTGTLNTGIRVYADDNLVYDSNKGFSRGSLAENISVNISGCKKLKIVAYGVTGTQSGYIQLDNARVIG